MPFMIRSKGTRNSYVAHGKALVSRKDGIRYPTKVEADISLAEACERTGYGDLYVRREQTSGEHGVETGCTCPRCY